MDIRLNMKTGSKTGWRIFIIGFSSFLLGFLLWNIDNHFCNNLKSIRNQIGPLGPATQLHGWWHIFGDSDLPLNLLQYAERTLNRNRNDFNKTFVE